MTGPLWLIVNRASGGNSDKAVREVAAALAAGGTPPAVIRDVTEGAPTRAVLDAAGAGVVAVFTGDGTINAVATGLEREGWRGTLLPLPGGTANLLARALHGSRPAAAIATQASRLVARRRHCIRWSGGTALAEVLAGPGAHWGEVREELRGGVRGGLLEGEVAGTAMAAIRESLAGPMVRLADPATGHPEGYPGLLLTPTPGGLLVSGYRADGPGDLLAQGVALLRRNFREGPHDALGMHPAVLCRSVDGAAPIALLIDGERRDGGPEERFSLAPFALDLLGSPP